MKTIYVYADFDWLTTPMPVGELSYESLRGSDSYTFKFDTDWLRQYGSLFLSADLNWRDKNSRSTLEMKDKSSRPAIQGRCENIADYDTVWIGFPVWWYTAPTIVNTFIEAHDLSGKVLNVFATSGGSGVTGSANDLKKAYPQYKWGESRLMNR